MSTQPTLVTRNTAIRRTPCADQSQSRPRPAGIFQRVLIGLGAATLISGAGCQNLPPKLTLREPKVLDQGWSETERQAYYHTAQGAQILPYDWFLNLEAGLGRKMLRDDDFVSRYRLLPNLDTVNNPDRLPVGVVKDVDDTTKKAYFGLTCAACHTGQIEYKGTALRIDGGEGQLDLTRFIEVMFTSLTLTLVDPFKFDRFANRVLGDHHSDEAKRQLRAEVKEKVGEILAIKRQSERLKLYPVKDGFGRQDALGHGGNNGFSKIGIESNLRVADAPVSYPAVWQALNWDWVQYNGSIRQPMARNVGEVLGVGGTAILKGKPEDLYKSTVKVLNLHAIETQIHSLKPPPWPEDVLGKIDREKAARGSALFQKHCAPCHVSKMNDQHDYIIKMIPLEHIGTDPKQAVNLHEHKVDTGDLGKGIISAGAALQLITEQVAQRKYKELGVTQAEQDKFNRGKPNEWRAELAYRAHTLYGIWATPPYLHNGSVPNLYEFLSPVAERSKTFYTGNLEFDPVHLGYQKGRFSGGFLFQTSLPGNSNAGHEFRNAPRGKGVIGPELTPQERMDLIEFVKTR